MVLRLRRSVQGWVSVSALGVPGSGTWTRPSDGPSLARVSLTTWRLPAQGNRAIGSWVQIPCCLGDLEPMDMSLGLSLVTCEMGGRTVLCGCFKDRSVIPRSTQSSLWAPHRLWFGRWCWASTTSKILKAGPGGGEGLAGAGERRASRGCGCPALESSNEGRVSPRRGLISAQPATLPIDKLFGKRLLQAGRYLVSHKAWMKTVPTEDCDVLMTFPGIHACLPWARLDAAFTASAEMWRPLRAPLRQDPLAPMPLGRHH